MPQLPSGRHVAICPEPLYKLLVDSEHFGNVHKVLEILDLEGVKAYVEVVYFVPESEAPDGGLLDLHNGSMPAPPGFVAVQSGYTLADWGKIKQDWTLQDQAAMREFLDGRAAPLLAQCLDEVKSAQERLRNTPEFLPRLLSGWHDAGIHPLQTEGDDN